MNTILILFDLFCLRVFFAAVALFILYPSFLVVMLADVVQILKRGFPRLAVRHHRVFQTPLSGEELEFLGHFRLAKLRHIREQMVDDLAV